MKIYVRRRHIEKGAPDTANYCPVALALQDAIGVPPERTDVSENVIKLGNQRLKCPSEVARFIASFDAGKSVRPFVFILK